VLPALEEANKALDTLKPDDISNLKSYAKPPPILDFVMQGVILTLGEEK
jgi:hypothetical protein